jgi:hypothetical protein
MLGWFVIVSSQTPEEIEVSKDKTRRLATWKAGIYGTNWLDDLVTQGKATQLLFDGYPLRYTAAARDVIPLIEGGPPRHAGVPVAGEDYFTPAGWTGEATFDAKQSALCAPDQRLTIDAWDES